MKLSEFPIDTTIILTASLNGTQISFESKIIGQEQKDKSGNIWTEIDTCYQDDKPIVFGSCSLSVMVINPSNNRDYKYNIFVARLLTGKRTFIFTDEDCRPLNRRESVRVPICTQCNLQVGNNKKTIDCITVDVSTTGMCISFMNNYPIAENDFVSGTFYVERTKRIYRFQGHVMRVNEHESGFKKIGIRFVKFNAGVSMLIAILQRDRLKKERGEGLYVKRDLA